MPENFDWPYFRTSIVDFWRHWHISLYRWLVDYVFIPLGGSRVTLPFVCRNVFIVMLVSGVWHGAGANFVVWGAWHGVLLVTNRLWAVATARRADTGALLDLATRAHADAPPGLVRWPRLLGHWALTYVAVNLGWAFFAMDMPTALFFYRRLLLG